MPLPAKDRLMMALTTMPPEDAYQSEAVRQRRGWIDAVEWLIERGLDGAAHSLLDATVGWADFSHPHIPEQQCLVMNECVKIIDATRNMIPPLRSDALAMVRRTAREIEHLNELDGKSG